MPVAIFRFVRVNGSLYIHVHVRVHAWVGIITEVVMHEGRWDYGECKSRSEPTDRQQTRLAWLMPPLSRIP